MKDYATLLKNAPPHNSEEFLQYLRDNNEVVADTQYWIIINNVKYEGWQCAFLKFPSPTGFDWEELMNEHVPEGYCVLRKPAKDRTVSRFHVHIFKNVY